ncbi:MAG: hypothetical protein RL226_2354 [Bacteroidota bacterium]
MRFLSHIMLVWYTVFSFGLTVHLHYCCGNLASFGINVVNHDACEDVHTSCNHHTKDTCCASSCSKPSRKTTPIEEEKGGIVHDCCSSDDFFIGLDEAHLPINLALCEFQIHNIANFTTWFPALPPHHTQEPVAFVRNNGPPDFIRFCEIITYG